MKKKQIIGSIMAATGKSVDEFAQSHGYTKHCFYYTISGKTRSQKVRGIIADTIGKPVNEIWPDTAKDGKK